MSAGVLRASPLRSTGPDIKGATIAGRALGYSVAESGVTPVGEDDLSGRWPSGGYLSTTDDLARLGRSILAPGLLNAQSLLPMLTPQTLTSGAKTSVGIGWRISADSAGRRYAHHGGTSSGGTAFLLVYPEEQLIVAMAANAFTAWGERDALAVAEVFLRAR